MATRTLLCVEPDEATLATIKGTLEPYGFVVENITNGDLVVERAKKDRPALMMVSVEPKKVGYAICNKIKRSADLKDIPLILTSAEESPDKFEQHKGFKLRADEYMFKPLDRHELMRHVNILIGLDEPEAAVPTASAELFAGSDVISNEIAIDADDIVDESKLVTPPPEPVEGAGQGLLRTSNPALDAVMFEKEADAAFDALELATPEPTQAGPSAPAALDMINVPTPPPVDVKAELPPVAASVGAMAAQLADAEDSWAEEGATRVVPSSFRSDDLGPPAEPSATESTPPDPVPAPVDLGGVPEKLPSPEPATAEVHAPPAEIEGDPELLRQNAPVEEDVPPLPDEVRNTSVTGYASTTANDAAFSDLQKRIHDLEDEKRELASVIEDLRSHLQAQPLNKERDLLSLRETINRKEKDILDLRDALDAKDRQLLDQKDRMREQERGRRDVEEKMLTFEKNLMHANEKVMALAQDKEKGIERERGLKARLDDSHAEITKTHDELDVLKKRLATLEERAKLEVERVRNDLTARIAEDAQAHQAEIARLRDDREAEKASRENEVQAEIGRLNANHAAEVESLTKRHADEKAGLEEAREIELGRLRREQDKALQSLREEHSSALENETQAHKAALEAKERDFKNEMAELRRSHDGELATAEDKRRRELEEAEVRRVSELDAADARRRAELQARDEQHHAATADLERRALGEKNEAAERHRGEMEQARSRAAEIEAELASRSEELAEAHRRLLRVEGELDTARTDIRDREVKLGQARDRITELESKVADLEDQALRAYRRIKDDEKAIDKAKRALSVALTVLDDRSSPGSGSISRAGDETSG